VSRKRLERSIINTPHVISKQTTFGRHLYAIGGNTEAARISGIKVERKVVAVFALMGFLAASLVLSGWHRIRDRPRTAAQA
jgi:ABC-type xylose transport system permease subunit